MTSPFLTPEPTANSDTLAILHLRRDQVVPTILRTHDDENKGYEEGKVTTTRYGSFPHSTIIGKPWGSLVPASNVNTGIRGQKKQQKFPSSPLKRKVGELGDTEEMEDTPQTSKTTVAASSGFIYLAAPTPETWTASLPHRTQVVYTPDYSYILHRLRARPGSTVIEAGAGSGSFTHASARAVFNGYSDERTSKKRRLGKVCSFEFHEQRAQQMRQEIHDHGLGSVVEVNHRDVYKDGFLLPSFDNPGMRTSPRANAVFLDLPAPWLALKHLVRQPADGTESPLDPLTPINICAFSPCIEQVQQTVSALRQYDWISISMVEIEHRQVEIRRERHANPGDTDRKGVIHGPRSVEEAVAKLQAIEEKAKITRAAMSQDNTDREMNGSSKVEIKEIPVRDLSPTKPPIPTFRQGHLTHRWEPELKTHTSYLVFAILPVAWTDADERKCRGKWRARHNSDDSQKGAPISSKKQMKREAKERAKMESQGQKYGLDDEERK